MKRKRWQAVRLTVEAADGNKTCMMSSDLKSLLAYARHEGRNSVSYTFDVPCVITLHFPEKAKR